MQKRQVLLDKKQELEGVKPPKQALMQHDFSSEFADDFDLVQLDQEKVRGEKQWNAWAQDLENYGIKQETKANTRLPYFSTLQISEEPAQKPRTDKGPVRGERDPIVTANMLEGFGDYHTGKANSRIPYQSTLQLN